MVFKLITLAKISLNLQERNIMQRYFSTLLVALIILGFAGDLLAQTTNTLELIERAEILYQS